MCAQKIEKEVSKTILAVTDFSKSSTHAILVAANLFKDKKLKLLLLHIFENLDEAKTMLILVDDILGKESEKGLKKQSAEIHSIFKDRELDLSTFSMSGKLKKGISTIIQTQNIDLIVTGTTTDKYPCKNQKNLPILFMGQNRYPVLLVPENCSDRPVKNILAINLNSGQERINVKKTFEHIINHDHLAAHTININEKKIDSVVVASLHNILTKEKADIIIVIPSPGDNIDRALLDLQVDKLCPIVNSLLRF